MSVDLTIRTKPDMQMWQDGYVLHGETWAVVHLHRDGDVSIVARGAEQLAQLQRLADTITDALAQARHAEQDAEFPETVPA